MWKATGWIKGTWKTEKTMGWEGSCRIKMGGLLKGRIKQTCIGFWALIPNELANLFSCGSCQVISAIASDDCCAFLRRRGSRHGWRNVGFNSWPGEGWKKQKMTPYIWKVWCFLLVPLAPTALPFLPPTHTLIKRRRISSYAVLGNALERRRRCNQCVILLLGTSAMCTVLGPLCQLGKRQSLSWKFPQCWGKQYFWRQIGVMYVSCNMTLSIAEVPVQQGTELGHPEKGRTLHSQTEDGKHLQEIKVWCSLEGNLVRSQAFDADTSLISCLTSAARGSKFQ